MKKSEILLDAIGEADDGFINDAHSVGKEKRKIRVAVLIAAVIALLAVIAAIPSMSRGYLILPKEQAI